MEIVGCGPVAQVLKYKESTIALVDLGRDASEALRASWSADRPFQSGGVIESAWLLPMVGVGSAAASSLFAGNVFLATANPATLMTIGTGVGSAIMQGGTIVAHAPFVAASGALMPVMAPMLLFATVSSVMICARLDRVQRSLGRLFDVVEAVRRHLDAEDYARFETAMEQFEDIRSEFEHYQRFASDVPDKLSRIEDRVSLLRSKYGLLMARDVHSEEDAKSAVLDINRFFLASLCDLQIDLFQLLCLALQNDSAAIEVIEFRQSQFREKVERYGKDFRRVLDADPIGVFHRKLKGDLAESRWRYLPRGWRRPFGRELATRVQSVRAIRKDFNSVEAQMNRWIEASEAATDESIVFYREPEGERELRAYHTRDIRLKAD